MVTKGVVEPTIGSRDPKRRAPADGAGRAAGRGSAESQSAAEAESVVVKSRIAGTWSRGEGTVDECAANQRTAEGLQGSEDSEKDEDDEEEDDEEEDEEEEGEEARFSGTSCQRQRSLSAAAEARRPGCSGSQATSLTRCSWPYAQASGGRWT